ncbi:MULTISPECIES: hypothetical protein [Rhizobium]|uniref:hypothetical protein n=1 Tax=Rhizobium TaxID=379 RepID=UPI0007F12130|nr:MULTISPECIES: hypothetical protein [Rhizobium]ANL02201.1 hypothetical protein AMJ99_CH00606 [Rhizobium esperanzae]ANL08329.1 hypothetical protein AMJ98_CH00606 [Rhizobium sp. N1341]ANM33052.1 hypothetical protein AMK04_CH00606 [Rhizobium sp. N871]ANM39170.1 hypothetical protein AMK03_CH00606 [Rhizobium sp. N741]
MEATHTLDLSRLRILEGIKTAALGAAQLGQKKISDLQKDLEGKRRQLQHAQNALETVSRGSHEVVTEGMTIISRWSSGKGASQREFWSAKIQEFEAECVTIEQNIREIDALRASDFERFNEASYLFDACKTFAAEYLQDGGSEQ